MSEVLARARRHSGRLAVAAGDGDATYGDLLASAAGVARRLLAGRSDLDGARVALWLLPGRAFVAAEWGIWRAGGVAVPLALGWPAPELEHALAEADVRAAVVDPARAPVLAPLAAARGFEPLVVDGFPDPGDDAGLPTLGLERDALVLFTSGTTGRPKAAVHTHGSLAAQHRSLEEAWGWRADDRLLAVLPLHHLHGLVVALGGALWAGATAEVMARFEADEGWERLASGRLSLFMAVPTIYGRLVTAWEEAPEVRRRRWSEGARRLRLMTSGSAALPVPLLARWETLTGHRLLERYGMTEIGMALSNPLDGERLAGAVGRPLPGVETRLVGDDGAPVGEGTPGELEVRGPCLFRGYQGRPEATAASFREGWFRTGDVAVCERGVHRLLGRQSTDILKTGGEKVSALEIEATLREHPAIADCTVVGVPDPRWGDRVVAVVVPRSEGCDPEALRGWAKERLAAYKVPREVVVRPELPRNAMGKVTKPVLVAELTARRDG